VWEAGSNLWWSPGDIISDCRSPDRSTRLIRGTPAGLITNARRNLPQPPFSRVFAFRSRPVHALSPSPNLTCVGAFSQRVQGRMRRLCGRHKLIAYCRGHYARFPAEGAHVAYLAARCKAPQGRQFRPSAGNAGYWGTRPGDTRAAAATPRCRTVRCVAETDSHSNFDIHIPARDSTSTSTSSHPHERAASGK
jgi:hypothetical protein